MTVVWNLKWTMSDDDVDDGDIKVTTVYIKEDHLGLGNLRAGRSAAEEDTDEGNGRAER